MCLLLPCSTGFLATLIANLLPIINLTSLLTLIFKFCNKFIIQTTWHTNKVSAMYSVSQVDKATTGFFLEHQKKRLPDTWKNIHKYFSVNFVSTLIRDWIAYQIWVRFNAIREQHFIPQSTFNVPQNPDSSLVMWLLWPVNKLTHHSNYVANASFGITNIYQWASQLFKSCSIYIISLNIWI